MRWSSGTARLGEEGHPEVGVFDAENGDGPAGQPWSRISADVWRLAILGGISTFDKGCGPGGGGAGAFRRGEDCVVLLPPIDRRVLMDKLEGIDGR